MLAFICEIFLQSQEGGPYMISCWDYMLYHANVFHLACNILALWLVLESIPWSLWRWRFWSIPIAYFVGVLCWCVIGSEAIGLSGLVYAIYGMWASGRGVRNVMFISLMFGPFGFDALLHIYCLWVGVLIGMLCLRRLRK